MPNKDNAGEKTKKKGQRLKIEEIESVDDATVGNRVDDLRPGNEKSEENIVPNTVKETELETSKKILEDLKVVNSVKDVKQGMSGDNSVNGETSVRVACVDILFSREAIVGLVVIRQAQKVT